MVRERVVIFEGLDERDIPVREVEPVRALPPMFVGTGPARGQWEEAQVMAVEYVPPVRRAA